MNQPNQPQAWEKEFDERFLTKDGLISGDDIKAFISEQIAEAKRQERERIWEFLMPSPKTPKP